MTQQVYIARLGLGIRTTSGDSHILNGTVDPSVTGVAAPISSIYFRINGSNTSAYIKNGALDTDWSEFEIDSAVSTGNVPDVDTGSSVQLDSVLTAEYKSVKWIVNASKGSDLLSFELHATAFNSQVTHNISSINKIGDPSGNFGLVADVNLVGAGATQEMQLSCTVTSNDVVVDFTRILVV